MVPGSACQSECDGQQSDTEWGGCLSCGGWD